MPIPLTSVRSPMRQMGARALDLLVDLLAGRSPESERLRPQLITRASTDPAKLSKMIEEF